MAFSVSSISTYTDQLAGKLIKKSVVTGPTLNLLTSIQYGVKGIQAINIITNTVVPQAAACGFTSSGSVAFSQRNISVTDLMIQESLCETTLEPYWMGMKMEQGAPDSDFGAWLAPILGESYVEAIQEKNEYNIWQGNLSGSTSYTLFNGFLRTIFDESGSTVEVPTYSATTIDSTNVVAAVEYYWSKCPVAIRGRKDLALLMPLSDFDIYTAALRTANLYHYNATQEELVNGVWKINYIPGLTVYGIPGMNGAKTDHPDTSVTPWVLTYIANLVIGTDMMNEWERFKMWWSVDNQEVRVDIRWKIGTQIQFPEHIVTNLRAYVA